MRQCNPASRRILSDRQLITMGEMREKGWSYRRISEYFADRGTAIKPVTIAWQCMRVGADKPVHLRDARAEVTSARRGRAFTPAEDELIIAQSIDGLNIKRIAMMIGRRPQSVSARLLTLARRDARLDEEMEIAA